MRRFDDGSVRLSEVEAKAVAKVLELGHKLAEMCGGSAPDEDTVEEELMATIDLLAMDQGVTPLTLTTPPLPYTPSSSPFTS